MDPLDAYGDALRRALHAEVEYLWPARDGLDGIRSRIENRPGLLNRVTSWLLQPIELLLNLLAAITPRREAAMPDNVRRPLELHRGDLIVARPPNPIHPEHDGEPGHWQVTGIERVLDRVAIDATDPDGADWRFVPRLTDPIEIEPRNLAKETTR